MARSRARTWLASHGEVSVGCSSSFFKANNVSQRQTVAWKILDEAFDIFIFGEENAYVVATPGFRAAEGKELVKAER